VVAVLVIAAPAPAAAPAAAAAAWGPAATDLAAMALAQKWGWLKGRQHRGHDHERCFLSLHTIPPNSSIYSTHELTLHTQTMHEAVQTTT